MQSNRDKIMSVKLKASELSSRSPSRNVQLVSRGRRASPSEPQGHSASWPSKTSFSATMLMYRLVGVYRDRSRAYKRLKSLREGLVYG